MEYKCTELKKKSLKRNDWIIGPEKYGTQFVDELTFKLILKPTESFCFLKFPILLECWQ